MLAYLLVEQIEALLPISFGFAAGAMLSLIAAELVPQAFTRGRQRAGAAGSARRGAW